MKIPKKYVIVFFACLSLLLTARAKKTDYSLEAVSEAGDAVINAIGATGAVQVSQVHVQAQTEIQVLLVKQLDEVIELLGKPETTPDGFTDQWLREITKQLRIISNLLETPKQTSLEEMTDLRLQEITKLLKAPNPNDSATMKSLQNTGYILYGILTIGIILIFQLLLISSKLRDKKTELNSPCE